MIELAFNTDDSAMKRRIREYWMRNSDGQWTFTVKALALSYGTTPSSLARHVRQFAQAKFSELSCKQCGRDLAFHSRTEFDSLLTRSRSAHRLTDTRWLWCSRCVLAHRLRESEAVEAQRRAHGVKVEEHLLALQRRQPAKDYASATPLEAFLLYGLISGTSDQIFSNGLDAWDEKQPRLFAHNSDTGRALQLLHELGCIYPSVQSNLQAFHIEGEHLAFPPLAVHWRLTTDATGASPLEIQSSLTKRLRHVHATEIKDLWYWVCISELHQYFDEVCARFRFLRNGWTPLIERNLHLLLADCSLGQAKAVIWSSIKNTASLLQDSRYSKPHVQNMVPGSFARTLAWFRAHQIPIRPWSRERRGIEAVLTSLLFDTLIGQGEHAYQNFSATHWTEASGTEAPNRLNA